MNHSDIYRKQYAEDEVRRHQAVSFVTNLLDALAEGEIDEEYHYGKETKRAEVFMLAGNGPSAWAVFFVNGRDDVEGYVEFNDGRSAYVPLPDWRAKELYQALKTPA